MAARGRVAQLGERLVRNEEAGGSNPLSSTRFPRTYIAFENKVLLVLPANERNRFIAVDLDAADANEMAFPETAA